MPSHQALIYKITKIVCHYRHISHDLDFKQFSENRWLTYCPVHEPDGWKDQDNAPNLHIYIGKHKQTGQDEIHWDCKSRGCDKNVIKEIFIKDGLWEKPSNSSTKRNLEILSPSDYDVEPDWSSLTFKDWPVKEHWAFINEQGKIAFWHVRADNPNKTKSDKGSRKKQYSRYFYVQDKDTGSKFFTFASVPLPAKPIPYNAFYLQHRLNAPVMIVEGPKTADAASQLYPNYLVLTWDQGSNNYNKFSWDLLRGRTTQIVLFPDNDADGIKAMKGLGKLLMSLDLKPKIAFQEKLSAYPEGWDLADPVPEYVSGPNALLEDLEDIEYSEEEILELKNNVVLAQKLEEYDRRFMPVLGAGDFFYYDVENPTLSSSAGCPFPMYKERALYTAAADKYFNEDSGEQEYVMDVWKEQPRKILYQGLTYNPATTKQSIQEGSAYYLNMFIGFATKPIEASPEESQWFTNHIYNLQGKEAGDYTISYIADMIQNPGRKPGTMMLWVGTQGNGKSLVGKVIVRLLGHLNAIVMSADVLNDQFTTEYASKLFVMPEEVPMHHRAREAIEQRLKYLITAENIRLNTKNSPAFQIPSYHRIILTANSIHGMNLDEDERRITIIDCKSDFLKKQNSMIADRAYFDPLFAKINDPQAMGKLMYYLSKYEISIDITKPFITKVKQEHQRPKDPIQATLEEMLNYGMLPEYFNNLIQNWPVGPILLPRSLMYQAVVDYCMRNKVTPPSSDAVGKAIVKLMPPKSFSKVSTKNFQVQDKRGAVSEKRDRVVELLEINEHRRFYEEITGRRPEWSEIDSHEVAIKNQEEQRSKDSNVVPLKPKAKDETIL